MPSSPARAPREPTDWSALATASPVLAAVPEEARAGCRLIRLAPTSTLFFHGTKPTAMYFVLGGEVRLVRRTRAGGEVILQRTTHGMIAEASLDQPAYHCDAIVARSSEILAIPRPEFTAALAGEAFRAAWFGHVARELRRLRAQAERLSLRTARERIVHYIETEGSGSSVTLKGSVKDWASELGLSHEALYRSLAAMRRSGSLVVDGGRLRLT